MNRLKTLWENNQIQILFLLYAGIAIVAAIQGLELSPKQYVPGGHPYKDYNNYVIFRQSYFHIREGKNLYQPYPDEQWDLYKYSPTFAISFVFFALLPDWLGFSLWCLLNALLIVIAIAKMPAFSEKSKAGILLFSAIELLGSLQNAQSNGLVAGLLLMGFLFLETRSFFWGAACLVACAYIKIFGIVAFSLFLLYPEWKRLTLYAICWFVVLALLPLPFTGFEPLVMQYKEWYRLLAEDIQGSQGLSLNGILDAWFGVNPLKKFITGAGIVIFCLPLLRFKLFRYAEFRYLVLASVLLWVIAFNHKAESPTFIIATLGMAIWYYIAPRGKADRIIFIVAFVLTTLSVTDLCPRIIRDSFIIPFAIKGVMTVIIWFKVIRELMTMNFWKMKDQGMKTRAAVS